MLAVAHIYRAAELKELQQLEDIPKEKAASLDHYENARAVSDSSLIPWTALFSF